MHGEIKIKSIIIKKIQLVIFAVGELESNRTCMFPLSYGFSFTICPVSRKVKQYLLLYIKYYGETLKIEYSINIAQHNSIMCVLYIGIYAPMFLFLLLTFHFYNTIRYI